MRQIAESFFERSPAMAGPLIAMLIFFVVFALVIVRVVRAPKCDLDRSAHLPLEEGEDDV
jgi:hypothetical protein